MPPEWSDYPARVERFGDLFHILEGLALNTESDFFHSGHFARVTPESAYTVEFPGPRFVPVPDRIPGWDRLATLAEREYGRVLTLPILRVYRGRVSDVLDVTLAEVDAMTVAAVAETLEAAARNPGPPAPTADPFGQYRWLRVTDVAKLVWGKSTGPLRGRVSKMSDDGGPLVTNGQTGPDRRVDALSVIAWKLAQTDDGPADGE